MKRKLKVEENAESAWSDVHFFLISSACSYPVRAGETQNRTPTPTIKADEIASKGLSSTLKQLLAQWPNQSEIVAKTALDHLSKLRRLVEYEIALPAAEDRTAGALNVSDFGEGGQFDILQRAFRKIGMRAEEQEVWRLGLKAQVTVSLLDSEWSLYAAPHVLSSVAIVDPPLFRECLRLWHGSKPDHSSSGYSPEARAARFGAAMLEGNASWGLAKLWRNELIVILQEGTAQPPDALARAYFELGALERYSGASIAAERNLQQALALHQSARSMLAEPEVGRLFAYLAELADARLDPRAAVLEFSNMAKVVETMRRVSPDPDYNEKSRLWGAVFDLLRLHAKGHFCRDCADELVPYVKRILRHVLTVEEHALGIEEAQALRVLRLMPNRDNYTEESSALEERLLARIDGLFDQTAAAIRSTLKAREQLVTGVALAEVLGGTEPHMAARFRHYILKLPFGPNESLAADLWSVEADFGEHGLGEPFFGWLLNVADDLQGFGLAEAARQHLAYFARRTKRLHLDNSEQSLPGLKAITEVERVEVENRDTDRAQIFGPGLVAYARMLGRGLN